MLFRKTADGTEFDIRLKPRSSRNAVLGEVEGILTCAVNAPPVNGKANEALIELLAEHFDVPRKALEIKSGATSRNKRILLRKPFDKKLVSHNG